MTITYTAKSLDDIAQQFERFAENNEAFADGRKGWGNAADRRNAKVAAGVWRDAADVIRRTTLLPGASS